MKLDEMLIGNIIQQKNVNSWEEAIKIVAQPLIQSEVITNQYIDAVIQNIHLNGTYMVVFDYFVIPHARPDQGSIKEGVSFLKLEDPVLLVDKEVKYLLMFSTSSNDKHIEFIKKLGTVLGDEDRILEQLEKAITEEEIKNIFKGE